MARRIRPKVLEKQGFLLSAAEDTEGSELGRTRRDRLSLISVFTRSLYTLMGDDPRDTEWTRSQ